MYLRVPTRFLITFALAFGWFAFSAWLSLRWMDDLSRHIPYWSAVLVIVCIALLPGFMNAFLSAALALDRRPRQRPVQEWPGLTVLVAAYNEAAHIRQTVDCLINRQDYAGPLEVIVIDDGSRDGTADTLADIDTPALRVIRLPANGGKARAMNAGLAEARHDLVVTVDADTYLWSDALSRLVARYLSDPPGTVAVAGAVLVRNSRANWITRLQEWDYFHGIASIKRVQSFFQGTLVAQGAFSLYRREVLLRAGGWPEVVGEDIVLTWDFLKRGERVGFAEDAIAFTNVPTTYRAFFQQRKRWARGLIEAFKHHPEILLRWRLSSIFIFWNLFFPLLDFMYVLVFLPGIVLALFGHYFIAGPMTLTLLPLGIAINLLMFKIQKKVFDEQRLRVRRNIGGFLLYVIAYGVLMQPAAVAGYVAEFINQRKTWGTK